jgi:outer membrane PBP1 activator LpoA protein
MANEARNFLKGEKIKKIAVVLPLTGDYSELGKFVKEGIEKYSSSRFSLFYYDNAEDPLKTYEIMKEISQKKYDGVIGPLLSNNAVISSIFANIYNIFN